jgi:hypothetical protein
MRSVTSGRHGPFDLLVEAKGQPLHLGQIAASLVGRHHLTDFAKMLQHCRLAPSARRSNVHEFLLHRTGRVGGRLQQGLQLTLSGVNLFAKLATLGQITVVELPDAGELIVGQPKL